MAELTEFDLQLDYFRNRQEELANTHHGKFVLIYRCEVVDFFDSALEAYAEARKRKFTLGEFIIQPCVRPEDEPIAILHSRAAV